jgi:hypothetical protein
VRERDSKFVLYALCVCVRAHLHTHMSSCALYWGGCAYTFLQIIYCGYSSAYVRTESCGGEKEGKRLEN